MLVVLLLLLPTIHLPIVPELEEHGMPQTITANILLVPGINTGIIILNPALIQLFPANKMVAHGILPVVIVNILPVPATNTGMEPRV